MLSENFQKLLDIQQERYEKILADCRPYEQCEQEGDTLLHGRLVKDIGTLSRLTADFRRAALGAQSFEERKNASEAFAQASLISHELRNFLFSHMDQASVFRRKALNAHAELIHTVTMEIVTTNVAVGWALIEEILEKSKVRMAHKGDESLPESGGTKKPSHLHLVK